MEITTNSVLDKLNSHPGQGSLLEQIDKLLRKQQRRKLYGMLDHLEKNRIGKSAGAVLEKWIPQDGRRRPALLRYSLPHWQGYDELFWQALGDYTILALHRVKDVEFDVIRAKIKIQYFAKLEGVVKSPENIGEIIQGIAYLIDTEALPADFTRFRRMTERRGSLGEMSKEEAAVIGAALKVLLDLTKL